MPPPQSIALPCAPCDYDPTGTDWQHRIYAGHKPGISIGLMPIAIGAALNLLLIVAGLLIGGRI